MIVTISLTADNFLRLEDGLWSVLIRTDNVGLVQLINILRSRREGQYKIASPGAPMQIDLDRLTKEYYLRITQKNSTLPLPPKQPDLDVELDL